jgi:hypothetical protein
MLPVTLNHAPSTKAYELALPSLAKLSPFPKPNFVKGFMAPDRHLIGTTAVSRQKKLSFPTDSMTSPTQRLSLPSCWSHLISDAMAWTCCGWLPHDYRSFCHDVFGPSLVVGQASGAVFVSRFKYHLEVDLPLLALTIQFFRITKNTAMGRSSTFAALSKAIYRTQDVGSRSFRRQITDRFVGPT